MIMVFFFLPNGPWCLPCDTGLERLPRGQIAHVPPLWIGGTAQRVLHEVAPRPHVDHDVGLGDAMTPGQVPLHVALVRGRGVYFSELLDLDELAASGRASFLLVIAPLPLVGAVGSPVSPVAVI